MEKFTVLEGIAAPLYVPNVDTDVIIRIERLSKLAPDALGPWAFEPLRYRPDGSDNPDFVLNRPAFRGAAILVAGPNFGCGSSREMAVWAMKGAGISAVIAPSFGDIFFSNCFQNGVLPVRLPLSAVAAIAHRLERDPAQARMAVDLLTLEVRTAWGERHAFQVDAHRRRALLDGLDDIGLTLAREAQIAAFQATDRVRRPWIYAAGQ
jgi:3-isopropylmalate/(R)-2-methylmalate dehydratase small subunit